MNRVASALLCAVLIGGAIGFGAASPAFADLTVTDAASLQNAFAAGGTVTLGADIPGTVDRLTAPIGNPVVLDLNGHSVGVHPSTTGAGIQVSHGASLTVEDLSPGGLGTLKVQGGNGGSGIGTFFDDLGDITITGGTVVAAGGHGGSGIGSETDTGGGHVTITGGNVTALGNTLQAGIEGGDGGVITITGGVVTARGGLDGAGIGGGSDSPAGQISLLGGKISSTGGPLPLTNSHGAAYGDGADYEDGPTPITLGGSPAPGTSLVSSGPAATSSPFVGNGAPGVHFYVAPVTTTTVYQVVTFTEDVTFDSNGGSPVDTQPVTYGDSAVEPSVTREHYTFQGWHVGSASGPLYDFSTPVTVPVALVAAWRLIPAPTISGASTASATDDVRFDYSPTITGAGATVTASGSPSGLTVDAVTGEITGFPTALVGSYPVELTVTNGGGSASLPVTITVAHGIARSAVLTADPPHPEQGDTVTITVTAGDAWGNSFDATAGSTFTSSVASDIVTGNTIKVIRAGHHTITASVAGVELFATLDVRVAATPVTTGSSDDGSLAFTGAAAPWGGGTAALIAVLLGCVFLLVRRRVRRS